MSLKAKVEKIPGYDSLVRPLHYGRALMAAVRNGFPGKKMRVIAVTGTNGKTSTCFFIWKMLNEAGIKTGVMTTVGWGVEEITPQVEHMTTENVGILNERMRKIKEAGAEFLVLEVTSHALMQSRILGVPIEIGVFTNITPEHLDYHKTFEKYREAKGRLFRKAKTAVINADDANAGYFEEIAKDYSSGDILTYGIQQGEIRATEVEILDDGVKYACGDINIRTKIPGRFSVYNSLAAVCVGRKLKLTDEQIRVGILALDDVEGRMTDVKEGQDFTVIVDYAHQPDALENVFASLVDSSIDTNRPSGSAACPPGTLRAALAKSYVPNDTSAATRSDAQQSLHQHRKNALTQDTSAIIRSDASQETHKLRRIISVHGGAGRRDHSTREPRGEILGKYSDIVIITEDDSRDEDPAEIAEMFAKGAEKVGKIRGKDLIIELDREKAIRKALDMAKKGDLVLILGKGHEKTILRNDGPHDFEDIKVVKKILREKK